MNLKPLYEVKLEIVNNGHSYTIGDDPTYFPGVTGPLNTLSKPALLPWGSRTTAEFMARVIQKVINRRAPPEYFTDRFFKTLVRRSKKEPQFRKEAAARDGSAAHQLFDAYIRKEEVVVKDNQETVWQSFLLWLKKERLKIIQGDTKVASKQYGYGGSLDALAEDTGGKIWIIDFKTGNGLYDSHAYQVAAYAQAFRETYGVEEWPQAVIVRLDKDKVKVDRWELSDTQTSFRGFKAALDAYWNEQLTHFSKKEYFKPEKEKKINEAAAKRV